MRDGWYASVCAYGGILYGERGDFLGLHPGFTSPLRGLASDPRRVQGFLVSKNPDHGLRIPCAEMEVRYPGKKEAAGEQGHCPPAAGLGRCRSIPTCGP